MKFKKPVLGFAAWSGTGKTTLLVKLLPLLNQQGLRIAMIKHAHHDFDIDKPGKDSYELRKAGARQMLVASDKRWALMTENTHEAEPRLDELLEKLELDEIDLVLVEGFRHLAFDKIELYRPSTGKDLIFPKDENIIAVASDEKLETTGLPLLDLNRPEAIVDFIQNWMADKKRAMTVASTLQVNNKTIAIDREGYLLDPADWSDAVAEAIAAKEKIEMTENVWEVVNFVRDYYEERQCIPETRLLLKELRSRHGKEIATRKYIYSMFPYGFGQQACKIAGMRVPLKLLLDL